MQQYSLSASRSATRFWEVDVLRGAAFLAMASYHILFFLNFMWIADIPLESWPIWLLGKTAAVTFMLLVGASAQLRFWKLTDTLTTEAITRQFLIRALLIFGCGLIVTLVTAITIPEFTIIFGILQFIAVSTVIARVLVLFTTNWLVASALFSWVVGSWFSQLSTTMTWGLLFGIKPTTFQSLDYYPLFPWIGFICIGIVIGRLLYTRATDKNAGITTTIRHYSLVTLLPPQLPRALYPLYWAGRHALILYLVHMPIVLLVLWVLGILPK